MLYPTVNLDAHMTASAALARMARYGLWTKPPHEAARAWVQENAAEAGISFDDMAKTLERDPGRFYVAIRRQWGSNILWYSRPALEALAMCGVANPAVSVLDAMGLHEPDSRLPLHADNGPIPKGAEGVVLLGSTPIGVSGPAPAPQPKREEHGFAEALTFRKKGITLGGSQRAQPGSMNIGASIEPEYRGQKAKPPASMELGAGIDDLLTGDEALGNDEVGAPAPPRTISGFPRLEAPGYVLAERQFVVKVGLSNERMAGVAGGRVDVPVPAGVIVVDVDVELIADGLVAEEGWTRTLSLDVDNPTAASVEFKLRGKRPDNPEKMHLTTLEVRYVFKGAVCGFATRPLVIGLAGMPAPTPSGFGTPWEEMHVSNSPIEVVADPEAADLTIEIVKSDKNPTVGSYQCLLYSPHGLKTARGPFPIQLGSDAKTFAKETVEKVRNMTGRKTLDDMVRARAGLIADRLPLEVFTALHEVAKKVSPPTVLIVSAEQFVPWELAEMADPLDRDRPHLLGAQAIVGRWLRAEGTRPSPKPSLKPLAEMSVSSLAVMIGHYSGDGGFSPLPFAEKEAGEMKKVYGAVVVDANDEGLHQLLTADVPLIGSPGAIHFAGHGEYDPARVDSSVMFLSDGTEMDSVLFGGAKYGEKTQPLIFMNACMIGIGGEVLGASGGFPGNCLRGGFGAFVGALWEVNDKIAHDVALEFWKRALPIDGSAGESIGAILRDVRARYSTKGNASPIPTYLAYVYYGHPRLTLRKAA